MRRYQALIVDDEFIGRELMKKLVDWEKIGYAPPDTASNGLEALKKIEQTKYTIMFTDIEMPIMNGLELIKRAQSEYGLKNIVIISCHEKFQYAKEAMRLGIKDYVIKELAQKQELETLAISAKGEMPRQQLSHENRLSDDLRMALSGRPIRKEIMPCHYVSVFKVSLDDYDKICFEKGDDEIESILTKVSERLNAMGTFCNGEGSIYLIYETWESDSFLYFISMTYNIAQGIRKKMEPYHLGGITIGVSDLINSLSDLEIACKEADKAVDMRVIQGTDRTILYRNIGLKKSMVDMDRITGLLNKIKNLWMEENLNYIPLLDSIYEYEVNSGFADVNYYSYINTQLWTMVVINGQKKGYSLGFIFEMCGKDISEVNKLNDTSKMKEFFKSILIHLSGTKDDSGDIVMSAVRLIQKQYAKDISLTSLAEELHVHKSYLCRIFKEKIGENIVPYIERTRIEKAKEMLVKTDKKLIEISNSLGYATPSYFSYAFKKETGQSPSEYRKNPEINDYYRNNK